MLANIFDRILSLHGWVALAIVFAVPALEASAFVGFVFPGEIAVLLGGVLAFQHRIGLTSAIVAAVSGAPLATVLGNVTLGPIKLNGVALVAPGQPLNVIM